MRRAFVLAVVIITVGVTLSTPSASYASPTTVDADHLIIPGQSIGQFKLGMNVTDAMTILGAPKGTHRVPGGGMAYLFCVCSVDFHGTLHIDKGGLILVADATGNITSITSSYDGEYATAGGLSTVTVGLKIHERYGGGPDGFRKEFGAPDKVIPLGPNWELWQYRKIGLTVEFLGEAYVSMAPIEITVLAPTQGE